MSLVCDISDEGDMNKRKFMQEIISRTKQSESGRERRRYPRIPMALAAVFRGGILQGKPCVIRDFCPGGFFLSCPDQDTISLIEDHKDSISGSLFSVEFKVKHKKSGEKIYSIGFQVVRIFQGGIGVSFIEPDQKVLDVLITIAKKLEKKREKTYEKDTGKNSFNGSKAAHLGIDSRLSSILQTYFQKLDNKLHLLFMETTDEQEKFEYFNARETFSGDLDTPRKDLLKVIAKQLKGEDRPSWEKSNDQTLDAGSLSLVDEREFEAYLVLTGIISNAEADNRLLLFRLTKKLSEIYATEFDEGLNPIGFSRLFRTIDSYLQSRQFSYGALTVAYQQMGEVLVPELIMLYEELTEGIEDRPESIPASQSDKEPVASIRTDLEDKVQPTEPQLFSEFYQPNASGVHRKSSGTSSFSQHNSTEQAMSQSVFESGSNSVFPVLETNDQVSALPKRVNDLVGTLSALRKSMDGIPDRRNPSINQADIAPMSTVNTLAASENRLPVGEGHVNTGFVDSSREDLLQLLDRIQQEDIRNWQKGETIRDVTGRLWPMLSNLQKPVGEEVQGAIGLAGSVLDYLQDDEYLSEHARQNMRRMQAIIYKQAVQDGGLFQERSNPLRNVINLLEKLDRKGANQQPEVKHELDAILDNLLTLDSYDASSLSTIPERLRALLEEQNNRFKNRVEALVAQCDLEQSMLKGLRKSDDLMDQGKRPVQPVKSPEYNIWQERARGISQGDSIILSDGKGEKKHLSLAWSAPDSSRFVFVDGNGNKAADMSLQELIIRLLKGTAELTDENQQPLFDRAIVSGLFDAYTDINQKIVKDTKTGLVNEEKYRTELEILLENAVLDHVEHAFFIIELITKDDCDDENIITYLKHIALSAIDIFGRESKIGRLDKNSLGIAVEFTSREGSLLLAESLLKELEDNDCVIDEKKIRHPVVIGITVFDDRTRDIDQIIEQAASACENARTLGDNQACLYEQQSDTEEELDTNLIPDSIDWQFWLEEHLEIDDEIPLFGQKILDCKNEKVGSLFHIFPGEMDESGNVRTPERFIHASLENELIVDFEKKFIRNCLEWMNENRESVAECARCLISISGKTLNSKGILDYVISQLTEISVPPGIICFEVPGKPVPEEEKNIIRFIRTLNEFGCRFSLGRFGIDGLSREALKLPVDYICIDRILTHDAINNAQSYGLIKSVNDIAHMMDKRTIVPHRVEGETLELLQEIQIDYISIVENSKPVRLNNVVGENL